VIDAFRIPFGKFRVGGRNFVILLSFDRYARIFIRNVRARPSYSYKIMTIRDVGIKGGSGPRRTRSLYSRARTTVYTIQLLSQSRRRPGGPPINVYYFKVRIGDFGRYSSIIIGIAYAGRIRGDFQDGVYTLPRCR